MDILIGGSYILKKEMIAETKSMLIEGLVSMELSKRDFDICPPSAFKLQQYLINPQVWYNHDLWRDTFGNRVSIGKTLDIYPITISKISDNADSLAVLDLKGNLVALVDKPRADALQIKEGESGLWAKIQISIPEVWDMIEDGRLNAFSWQGKAEITQVWSPVHSKMVRQVNSVDLMEISVVNIPACEKSFLRITKSFVGCLAEGLTDIKKESVENNDFAITNEVEGHYHVCKVKVIDGMILGRTILTSRGDDHVHPINCLVDVPVTGMSNTGNHFHRFETEYLKKSVINNGINITAKLKKYTMPFQDLPISPIDEPWEFGKPDLELIVKEGKLQDCFLWRNENMNLFNEEIDVLTSMIVYKVNYDAVKLPIAKFINGKFVVVYKALELAMAQLMGANDGVSMTAQDIISCYDHLSKYFKKYDVEIPELEKTYSYSEYKNFLRQKNLEETEIKDLIGNVDDWQVRSYVNFSEIQRKIAFCLI